MPTNDHNIQAKIICDSVNKHKDRITTFVLTYPRIILAELNTHRMFSRSTASSRAIPVSKQIRKVADNPFIPSWIGKNQSGMQAAEEVGEHAAKAFKQAWIEQSNRAMDTVWFLENLGIHKQIANRLLEPWMYVTTILTATDFANFFKLRCHKDAQPEFQALAYKMLAAYVESIPLRTDLHVPFGDQMEHGLTEEEQMLVACARCARISYETHDGKRNAQEDIRLANQLIKAGHMSPFEHVARAAMNSVYIGNFKGWIQFRKKIPSECVQKVNYEKLLDSKPDWV